MLFLLSLCLDGASHGYGVPSVQRHMLTALLHEPLVLHSLSVLFRGSTITLLMNTKKSLEHSLHRSSSLLLSLPIYCRVSIHRTVSTLRVSLPHRSHV